MKKPSRTFYIRQSQTERQDFRAAVTELLLNLTGSYFKIAAPRRRQRRPRRASRRDQRE